MLVPSMNFNEIEVEANYEYDVLCKSSTLGRLTYEYFAERVKKKIKPSEKYYKYYEIKTKKKNKWLILILPKQDKVNVREPEDLSTLCLIYYYAENGLRIIATSPSKMLSIYNEHFFVRYNERLNLGIKDMKDVAKAYFEINGYVSFQSFDLVDNKRDIIGIVSNGFTLGQEIFDVKYRKLIILFRTFISRETANFKHAKSLFELEKFYNNTDDSGLKQLLDTLGFDSKSNENSGFFEKWSKLRDNIGNSDHIESFYQIVSDEEREASRKEEAKSKN